MFFAFLSFNLAFLLTLLVAAGTYDPPDAHRLGHQQLDTFC